MNGSTGGQTPMLGRWRNVRRAVGALRSAMLGVLTALAVPVMLAAWGGLIVAAARGQSVCEQWREGAGLPGVAGNALEPYVFALRAVDIDGPGPRGAVMVIGGTFATAGDIAAGNIAAWDGGAWRSLGGGAGGFNGTVYAMTEFNGELIAAGSFTACTPDTPGGAARPVGRIARWAGTSWQPLSPGDVGLNGDVRALAVFNGRLIATGAFTSAGGRSARKVAAWDGAAWAALDAAGEGGGGLGSPGDASLGRALAVYNGSLYIGGSFASAGGVASANLVRFDGTSFAAPPAGGLPAAVRALEVYAGALHVGGEFSFTPAGSGGAQARHIARMDVGSWRALGQGVDAPVSGLFASGNQLLVAGEFTSAVGAASASPVEALRAAVWDGNGWYALGAIPGERGLSDAAFVIGALNGEVIVGGQFETAGGLAARRLAAFRAGAWQPLGFGTDNKTLALTVYGGELIAGGSFTSLNGVLASRVASYDGVRWRPVGRGMTGGNTQVYALTVHKGRLIAGGEFTAADGVAAMNIAQWNGAAWLPMGAGLNGTVYALAEFDEPGDNPDLGARLYAAGDFSASGGAAMQRIARWNEVLSQWEPVGGGIDPTGGTAALALQAFEGKLYVGGFLFGAGVGAGAVSSPNLIVWDGASWSQPAPGTPNGEVRGMTVFNGRLIIGGFFRSAAGLPPNALRFAAAWDGVSPTWSAMGSTLDAGVRAFTVHAGRLIAGGGFENATGLNDGGRFIAAWDGLAWRPLGTGMDSFVLALASYDADGFGPTAPVLAAGGAFGTAGDRASPFLALWGPPSDIVWNAPSGGNALDIANWRCGTLPDATHNMIFDRTLASQPLNGSFAVTTTGPITARRLISSTDQVTLNLGGRGLTLTGPASDTLPPLVVGQRSGGFDARLLVRNPAPNAPATIAASGLAIGNVTDAANQSTLSLRDASLTGRIAGNVSVGVLSRGTLEVRDGATLRYGTSAAGAFAAGFFATSGSTNAATININGGGRLVSDTSIRVLSLAAAPGTRTSTVISGSGSSWSAAQSDLFIGDQGSATLSILNGAMLTTTTSNSVIVGRAATSSASVVIGSGSSWIETFNAINIGGAGGASAAVVTVNTNATLGAFLVNIFRGGVLQGSGTVAGDVSNIGTLRPGTSPGVLRIEGDYRQFTPATFDGAPPESGRLDAEIGGAQPAQYDRVEVSGQAELGGGLFVSLINGYTPAPDAGLGIELINASILDPDSRFDVAYLPPLATTGGSGERRFLNVQYPQAGRGTGPRGLGGTVLLGLGSLGAPISYGNPDSASVPGTPRGVGVGDFNGDGLDDLVVVVPDPLSPGTLNGSAFVLLNRGQIGGQWQGFTPPGAGAIQLSTLREPTSVAVADLNGDGRVDLAIANASSDAVTIFANTTAGPGAVTFAPAGTIAAPGRPVAVIAAPLNGPDRPELIMACEDDDTVKAARAIGAGFAFEATLSAASVGSRPRALAAFNPDQDKDVKAYSIAVANFASSSVSVLASTSIGPTGRPVVMTTRQTLAVGGGPVSIIASPLVTTTPAGSPRVRFTGGGLVGQGAVVLATANSTAPADQTASVIVPNADPATAFFSPFSPAVNVPAGRTPRAVLAADMDGDLDRELVLVTDVSSSPSAADFQLRVLRNDLITGAQTNQQLSFVPDAVLNPGDNPLLLAAGRLVQSDIDSPADLLTINDPGTTVRGAGEGGNIRPLRALNAASRACSPADIADTDGLTRPLGGGPDGAINNGDFFAFFDAFFADDSSTIRVAADIANTDGETTLTGGGPDGRIDNGDFFAFFALFFAGCE